MTLIERLGERAHRDEGRPLFTFVDDAGRTASQLSLCDLLDQSGRLATHLLKSEELSPGDRVVLVYPPSNAFVVALTACLRAGLVAMPVIPPDPFARDTSRLRQTCEASGAKALLTDTTYDRARTLGRLKSWATLRGDIRQPEPNWIVTDRLRSKLGVLPYHAAPDDLALLQYTSGSTAAPQGVRITHRNLAHQLEFNRAALGLDESARFVMWVPQYHDFGLISEICSALWGNGSLYFMSPFTFPRKPALWFELMGRVKADRTFKAPVASPNLPL